MLQQLVINGLAVIDSLDLEFKSGMTVLTGETGAGKSILLDALGLILGDRADTNIIRGNKDKTDITAVFLVKENQEVKFKLEELEIDADDELYIRRTISRDGRSRAYLNNTPVTIQVLKNIGEFLIDIHGQHAHQSLSRSDVQRELLDQFGQYNSLIDDVKTTYRDWKSTNEQLKIINSDGEDYDARLSLLKYQIEELTQLNITESEYIDLTKNYKRLSNSQQLLESCQKIFADLTNSDISINTRLAAHNQEISALCEIDNSLENVSTLLENATIQVDEASNELRSYIEQFDTDQTELNKLEERLNKYHELSRKHKVKPEALYKHLELLSEQLNQLEGGQAQHEILQKKNIELTEQYTRLATELQQERKKAAKTLSEEITNKMTGLGMGGKFNIEVNEIQDELLHSYGMDKVNFLVSTNPGQPLRPITKVASGGELSRLSLAIQIVGLKDKGIPTLIFDEVDAGISGGIAEIVGNLLNRLAEYRQVLCVTHLPQVASCGHCHLRVLKTEKNNETFTQVIELNNKERVNEIARMLAGMKVTDESRANAAQMLESV
ncbi:MAG: DNA repair protein RecN [Proteobacteria bacterium]|nr:DNA repair protein RecN [Pseudomonadota bacterium]